MKVSVIIATRNSEATIGECLSSIVPYYEMGYVAEIILVDGSSSDRTLEISNDYPVKTLHDKGEGVYSGLEIGWKQSTQELIMFLDSDAFLDANFFPDVFSLFQENCLGIIGCTAKAKTRSTLDKTIGQWWGYHSLRLSQDDGKRTSWLKRIYYHVTGFSGGSVYTSGPCYLVRRACLEQAGGFMPWLYLYKIKPRLMYPGDSLLSRRIIGLGWKATWWTNAPLYHYPPPSFGKFVRQRYEWGKGDAIILYRSQRNWLHRISPLLFRLGSPFGGIWLAIRYRNLYQTIFFPLAHYAWIAGYLSSFRFNLSTDVK